MSLRFKPEEFEHTTRSGRKFKLRELNAFEQVKADGMSENFQVTMYNRLVMSIVAIDDEELARVTSDLTLTARLEDIRGSEIDELAIAYVSHFNPRGEELKNESAPVA